MSDWSNQLKKYLQYERNEAHKEYIEGLVEAKKNDELEKLFGARLTFGTAGIRGRVGPGYGQMNDLVIIQTSQGLVSYLLELHGERLCKERGVIIGHDARYNSDRFARLAALAFLQKGIKVYYSDYIIPTPLVAFGVSMFKCMCGIVITASHNPKQDNGYKVYWSNGAQILSPHDKNIQNHIEKAENQRPWLRAWQHEYLTSHSTLSAFSSTTSLSSIEVSQREPLPKDFEGIYKLVHGQVAKSYFDYIKRLVGEHRHQNQSAGICITYTTMHGVGHAFLSRALELAGFDETFPVEAQKKPDPEFSTVKFPNPEEAGALDLAFETASHANSNLILANDPDADRCAAALYDPTTKSRRVLTGNEIGSLLGWWIWHCYLERLNQLDTASVATLMSGGSLEEVPTTLDTPRTPSTPIPHQQLAKPEDCYMLSTAVSSRFLQTMADAEGFKFIETLTGFKYMGNVAHDLIHQRNKRVLFAYEEAIGYMVDSQILDKDGISAAIELAQCAAYLRSAHDRTLEEHLDWLYLRYGYHYSLNSYFLCHEPRTIRAIFHALQSNYPKAFGTEQCPNEFVVTRIRDLNNGFDNGSPDHKATLPTSSSSFMVTFFIGDEIRFTIRTSGTEPKIKYYSEIVADLPKDTTLDDSSSMSSAIDDIRSRAKTSSQAKLARFVKAALERCLRPSYYSLEPAAGSC